MQNQGPSGFRDDFEIANEAVLSTDLPWFALYTTPRHEKRVALHLAQRAIEYYLPLYCVDRKWRDGSKVKLDLPLFPSYLFVRIRRPERANVLSVPGALAMVGGTGGEPGSVSDSIIQSLKIGLRDHKIEPHPLIRVGHLARILSGPFANLEGVVIRRKGGCRIVLTLEQIMQSVAVEVDEKNLESVTPFIPRHLAQTERGTTSFGAYSERTWQASPR